MLRCQSGDKQAFNILVERWHPKLIKQAFWHTKNGEAAKDIAQDCWQSIFKGLKNIKDPASFSVWAYRIVYRRSVDWIRGQQRDRNIKMDVAVESTPDNTDNQTEVLDKLKSVIRNLPDNQRDILTMFYLRNYSIREIGKIMGIPTGTVKSRLFHARERLKKYLIELKYEKEL